MSSAYKGSMFDLESSSSSSGKKRDTDPRPPLESPSKYQKLEDHTSYTRASSHRARGKESSRPLKAPPTMKPLAATDVFGTPAHSLGPSVPPQTPNSLRQLSSRDRPNLIDEPSPPVVRLFKRPPANLNPPSPSVVHTAIRPKSPPIDISDDDEVYNPPTMPPRTPSRIKRVPLVPFHADNVPLESRDFVAEFQNSRIGIDLIPSIIAHDRYVQMLLDKAEISWGVQYELARGVTLGLWDWDKVGTKISNLKGTSAEVAYRVKNIILDRPLQGTPDLGLWYVFITPLMC